VEALVRAAREAGAGGGAAGGGEAEAGGPGAGTGVCGGGSGGTAGATWVEVEEGQEDGEHRVRVAIGCTPRVLGKWEAALELARRVAGEALPTWACAEAIAAEAASALGAAAWPDDGCPAAQPRAAPERAGAPAAELAPGLRALAFPHLSWRAVPAPADPGPLAQLCEGLEECSPRELDRRLREAIAFQQRVDLERGRLLRQLLDRRLYRELGFACFEDYVRERVDCSPRTARRLVRLARAEHREPEVADAFREGRLTQLQAELLLRGGGPRGAGPDVAFAERVTLRRLEDEVGEVAVAFHAPPEVAALFLALVRRVGLEALLDHAIATWIELGRRFRDYADFERDGFRCTVPACSARRGLESHHLRFRSAGGADEPWNRTTLCAFHHRRRVHAGRVAIWGRAPEGLVFELGVGRFRSGDVILTRGPLP
jgi:hypothetical protein